MGKCDLELLVNACQASYRVTGGGEIDDQLAFKKTAEERRDSFLTTSVNIEEKGYKLTDSVRHKSKTSNVTAACFAPVAGDEPIVIAYKGTTTSVDVASDLNIVKTKGRALKQARKDAYDFYLKMREKYPDRQFVITGHSLGGNLAQDVALRGFVEHKHRNMVRTINSAPIKTDEGERVLAYHPEVLDDFVHYRLSRDLVSGQIARKMFGSAYGDIYCFRSKKFASSRLNSHMLFAVNDALRSGADGEMRYIQIGASTDSGVEHQDARMLEMIYGVQHSYETRVNGRWYSRFTMGPINIKVMDDALTQIRGLINQGPAKHEAVIQRFDLLFSQVSGGEARGYIKKLREEAVRRFFPGKEEKYILKDDGSHGVFHYLKALYQNIVGGEEVSEKAKKADDSVPPNDRDTGPTN